ncbi:MAG: hypothetical protein AAGL08_20235, partial [Cyanobacteria bacterium J06573_11]
MHRFRDLLIRPTPVVCLRVCLKGSIAIAALLGVAQQAAGQVISAESTDSSVTVINDAQHPDGTATELTII